MQVIRVDTAPVQSSEPLVLAIGKFDGVHVGHQRILRTAAEYREEGIVSVMSFWPHPAWVLSHRETYRAALTPFEEKCNQLSACGVQRLYSVEFSQEFAAQSADWFVYEFLRPLNPKRIVIGEDFRFGAGGHADVGYLRHLAGSLEIPVTVVAPVVENGLKISSSHIRAHLEHGRVEAAEALLGHPYSISGVVVHGDARGRQIGFPTANLWLPDHYVLPARGVYAVSVERLDGQGPTHTWFGVLNAGTRPTVDGEKFQLEVHILNFEGDLYDQKLRVSFLRRIRDERRFASIDELVKQIHADVDLVRSILGVEGPDTEYRV